MSFPFVFVRDPGGGQEGNEKHKTKPKSLFFLFLSIHKSRKLLAVAIAELYLEASAVCLQYFLTSH